jgi:hypothetical protein
MFQKLSKGLEHVGAHDFGVLSSYQTDTTA